MKDPQRLSAEPETSELECSLLEAGRLRREPEGARERIWAKLSVGVAGGLAAAAATETAVVGAKASSGLVGGTAAPLRAASSTGAGAGAGGATAKAAGVAFALTKAKLLAIGGALAAASVTAVALQEHARTTTAEVAPAPPASPPSRTKDALNPNAQQTGVDEPITKSPIDEPVKPSTGALPNDVRAPSRLRGNAAVKGSSASTLSTLREEAALLHDARAALARGDHDLARAKIDEARTRFPTGQLGPERDALEVRLAVESGDRADAARLARAFVQRYPDSALRPGIESIARDAEKD